ncbi:MAG: type IV toxin-antitoxin system AbiEi family antitoxin domain-containing protein [Acidimicrobiia bacterium]
MDQAIYAVAARQHGLFTRRQALDAGFTRSAINHRLRRGLWIGINRYVFALAGTPETERHTVMAAAMSAGPDAVATETTALSLLAVRGFALLPARVIVARRPARWAPPGVIETSLLPSHHRTVVDGIPTATAARALFDLSARISPRRLARITDTVLAARRTTPDAIRTVLDDLAISGRSGTAAMRAVMAERPDGYIPATNDLESQFLDLVNHAGLEPPARQVNLGGALEWIGCVDFLWRQHGVVVETDGGEHHASISDRENDERRDRALEAAGWIVLRFSWTDVTRRPTSVTRTLRVALAQAA